jgi:hypothetical protein
VPIGKVHAIDSSGLYNQEHKDKIMEQSVWPKATLLKVFTAILGALLILADPTPIHAYATCQHKVQKAQKKLERAIRRYGVHSPEAARRRDQLETAYARCRR